MTALRNFLLSLILVTLITGCHLIFHPDVEQGNLIKPEQIAALHTGMDKQQVEQLLGYPVAVNMYQDNHLVYVYTLVPGRGKTVKKQLIINLVNNEVISYHTNFTAVPQNNGNKT